MPVELVPAIAEGYTADLGQVVAQAARADNPWASRLLAYLEQTGLREPAEAPEVRAGRP